MLKESYLKLNGKGECVDTRFGNGEDMYVVIHYW